MVTGSDVLNAIPATIAALAALIAARRTGGKGDLAKRLEEMHKIVHRHITDAKLHPGLIHRRGDI